MIGRFTFAGLVGGLLLTVTGFALAINGGDSTWAQLSRLIHVGVGWVAVTPIALLMAEHRQMRGDEWDGVAAGALTAILLLSGLAVSVIAVSGAAPQSWLSWVHSGSAWLAAAASLGHIAWVVRRRLSLRWAQRLTLPALLAVLLFAGVAMTLNLWLDAVTAAPIPLHYQTPFDDKPFKPANVSIPSSEFIHPSRLAGSARCGECHQAIYKQWSESMHRFSASDPHVDTGIRWFQRDNGIASGRFCAGCHNPIALLSGAYDTSITPEEHGTPAHDEGISCLVCHAIVDVSEDPLGNGSYVLHPPETPLATHGWLARLLVRTDIEGHKRKMMRRPLFQSALFCASCHQQYVPISMGGGGPADSVNQYPEWLESHYGDPASPQHKSCNNCHMPLVEAEDPAAVNGKIHSHRFIGANYAHPTSAGLNEQAELTLKFLRDNLKMTLRVAEKQRQNEHLTIEVVVTNTGAGHRFPSGTTDISEAWIEVVAGPKGKPIFTSGLLDKDHYLEQGAHVWRTVYVDRANLPVDLHNLAAVHDTVVDDYIEPGKSDVARFNIPLSGYNAATLRVRARLRMRKANQRWTDWLTNFDGGTDPVAEIFTKNLTAPLAGLRWETKKDKSKATPSAPAAPPPIGMVFVPAGKAQIGSDTGDSDEAPAQRLHIDAFYIDRFPITNAQYRRFLRAARQPGPVHKIAWAEKYNWRGQDYPAGTGDQPAILVSWEEAKGYCAWKGKRLPHEVEWEKTARGPNALVWPWGNRWEDGACPELDGVEVPPRVGMCPNRKSVYGAFEMVGGVYEWTADQYYAYDRTHLHRNANEWITVFGDPSLAVRGVPSGQVGPATTAMSRSGHADNMRARIGFRCALSPDKRGLQ